MTRVDTSILLAMLVGQFTVAMVATAQSEWALWQRQMGASGQPLSAWRRTQLFDAERWCKGAMTQAINQSLSAGVTDGRRDPRLPITEYQCLPAAQGPPAK